MGNTVWGIVSKPDTNCMILKLAKANMFLFCVVFGKKDIPVFF
jgi:hypothetical protein